MDSVQIETTAPLTLEFTQIALPPTAISSNSRISKDTIRTSLKASTGDAVLASVYSLGTGGILLSNLLVELGASPVVFGMLSSIPMLVNLIQPLGAYLSERSTSRFQYLLRTHGIGRLIWLILVIGIVSASLGVIDAHQLVILTLLIVLFSNLLGGLGSASWLSWVAMIVPRQLRGRFFGTRNSAANLSTLVCVPIAGLVVSHWYGGSLQGYGIVLLVSVVFGIIGLGCQYFQVDMNPRSQNTYYGQLTPSEIQSEVAKDESSKVLQSIHPPQDQSINSIWKNSNFLIFLLYFSFWTLAVNLSSPFFNLYMLDTLDLNVSYVTIYNSFQAGATLLMFILWGKLADKIGNRPILISIGILVAATPFLWLGISVNRLDIWLWLPLLHILIGGTWAAIDLCNNNIQLAIAPTKNQSIYFAIAAAVAGVSGALGTTIGSFIVQFSQSGGLLSLFVLSGVFRLVALVPLMFLQEQRG
ncbi:MAG: MFS transporter [Nostoc sp. DedQUE08]|uniref:MFS transporter n=1 Tax=unclassified Nostoc TaxID=2593658 RepID=UPI002AD48AF8|nr:MULTISPECIES: MFS transporter [unclassified Nostoc]MDZ8032339.1 MFS transporter [Nostoc sp. DedSLP04]MDZ8066458.1 MFS transporter [Nostoc sp. DedQUE08]MDZ8092824.1 MFS transporter [Nostoc sp. DedQUE05]MDZ8132850.1 MFS transporter [Nostoc sp. DedQUE07]MDZ8133896.1 MFS transporter [Nostoc sp. DedQUE04]